VNYRFADKFRTIAFGVFPDVSLADARARRDDARKLPAKGIDPSEERKGEEARIEFEATTSFEAVAEEWLAKHGPPMCAKCLRRVGSFLSRQ